MPEPTFASLLSHLAAHKTDSVASETAERLRAAAADPALPQNVATLLREAAEELGAVAADALRFRTVERLRLAVDGSIGHDWIVADTTDEVVGADLRECLDQLAHRRPTQMS